MTSSSDHTLYYQLGGTAVDVAAATWTITRLSSDFEWEYMTPGEVEEAFDLWGENDDGVDVDTVDF